MIIYLLPVHVFVEEKFTPIHVVDLSSCRFNNDASCSKIPIGLVGDDSRLGATRGNIAYVSSSASQIADFARKCGMVIMVKSGVGEEKTLVVNIFLGRDPDLPFSPEGFFSCLGLKKIAGCRHIKHA